MRKGLGKKKFNNKKIKNFFKKKIFTIKKYLNYFFYCRLSASFKQFEGEFVDASVKKIFAEFSPEQTSTYANTKEYLLKVPKGKMSEVNKKKKKKKKKKFPGFFHPG